MTLKNPINILIDGFLADQVIGEKSSRTYRSALAQFVNFMVRDKEADVRDPQKSDVVRWMKNLEGSGKAASTVENYVNAVIFFSRWLHSNGHHNDFTKGLKNKRSRVASKKRPLSKEQLRILLCSLTDHTLIEKRNKAIVIMIVRTGMRAVEISRIRVKDLNPSGEMFVLDIQRKGHKEKDQVIGIFRECIDPIDDYITERGNVSGSAPLFANHGYHQASSVMTPETVSRVVVKAMKASGLEAPYATCHSLRHTAAALASDGGSTATEIMQMLGHTSIDTTERYLRGIFARTRINNPAAQKLNNYINEHVLNAVK